MQRLPKAALAAFMTIALAALAGSCAGRRARNDEKPAALDRQRTAFEAQAAEAVALARAGAYEEAMRGLSAAMDSSGPGAFRDALLEARAWALFFSGSVEEARAALAEARRAGARPSPGQTVLEFRLAAQEGIASALRFAEAASRPELDRRAALAMAIMTGRADVRDLSFGSEAEVDEYATYLAGYTLAPEAAAATAASATAASATAAAALPAGEASATAPVIVVSEPEAVGADEATVAVARVACRDALARRGRFRVVDSSSRASAIEEIELSLSGATAGETDVAIGGLFSADYVASGSVIKADSGWLVAFTLSSAADGRIVASDFSQAVDHSSIIAAAGRFAAALDGLAP